MCVIDCVRVCVYVICYVFSLNVCVYVYKLRYFESIPNKIQCIIKFIHLSYPCNFGGVFVYNFFGNWYVIFIYCVLCNWPCFKFGFECH